MLKVDVERGEWEVLQGIEPQHWSVIQQVAMEVSQLFCVSTVCQQMCCLESRC